MNVAHATNTAEAAHRRRHVQSSAREYELPACWHDRLLVVATAPSRRPAAQAQPRGQNPCEGDTTLAPAHAMMTETARARDLEAPREGGGRARRGQLSVTVRRPSKVRRVRTGIESAYLEPGRESKRWETAAFEALLLNGSQLVLRIGGLACSGSILVSKDAGVMSCMHAVGIKHTVAERRTRRGLAVVLGRVEIKRSISHERRELRV